MSITVNFPLDELQLDELIAQSWTTLKLYVANAPEGPYTDSSVSPVPSTLAGILSAGAPYSATFAYGAGNGAQWFKVVASDGSQESSQNDAQAFHGGGGTTLQVIRQKIGKLTHTMFTGTTTDNGAADGSSAICTSTNFRRFRDNYFGGGTGIDGWFWNDLTDGQWSIVSGFVQATGVFNFSPSMSNQILTGTTFEVMARFTPDEYRDAINWALSQAYPILSKPVVDTGTLTEEDVFVYTVPFAIRIVNKIEIEQADTNTDSTDTRSRGQPWRQIAFDPVDDGLVRTVEFKTELDSDRRLRFTGTAMLSQVYNDNDYTEIIGPQVDLITYLAAHRLYQLLTNTDAASDIDRMRQLSGDYLDLYNENKARRATRRKSKKIWSHDAKWARY